MQHLYGENNWEMTSEDVHQVIIASGVRASLPTVTGKTPLDFAPNKGHHEVEVCEFFILSHKKRI